MPPLCSFAGTGVAHPHVDFERQSHTKKFYEHEKAHKYHQADLLAFVLDTSALQYSSDGPCAGNFFYHVNVHSKRGNSRCLRKLFLGVCRK